MGNHGNKECPERAASARTETLADLCRQSSAQTSMQELILKALFLVALIFQTINFGPPIHWNHRGDLSAVPEL